MPTPRNDLNCEYIFRNLSMSRTLTHRGRVTHICVSKLTVIGSDNGLSPGRRQAIIWTNAGMLLIGPLETNLSEILSEIHTFWLTKMHLKMSSWKWRPFCFGLNVLTPVYRISLSQWPLASVYIMPHPLHRGLVIGILCSHIPSCTAFNSLKYSKFHMCYLPTTRLVDIR